MEDRFYLDEGGRELRKRVITEGSRRERRPRLSQGESFFAEERTRIGGSRVLSGTTSR